MSTISFGGLASGLDTETIVRSLVALRRQPIERFQAQRTLHQKRLSALDQLKGLLTTLRNSALALDTSAEFQSKAATSSNDDVYSAAATSKTPLGSYAIVVDNLAATHRMTSQVFTATTDSVGTGTFTFTQDGTTTSVTLSSGASSLNDLKDAINATDKEVTASIINDGTGYRLMLSADDAGASDVFTVDASGLSGGTGPTMTISATGLDAQITIDGSIVITSASNTVTDALEGLTLTLESTGSATLNVTSDSSAIAKQLGEWKDAYNAVIDFLDAKAASGGDLEHSQLARSLRRKLSSTMAQTIATGGTYNTAASIGMVMSRDGKLSIDADDLSSALTDDYDSVLALFTRNVSASDRGVAVDIAAELDTYTAFSDGLIKVRKDGVDDRIDNLDDRIQRNERSLDKYEEYLNRKFTYLEVTLARLQSQSNFFGGGQ